MLSIIFYNYKQVILYSQTHQKKLERIDKVDERFWPLLPSDKEEMKKNRIRQWEKKIWNRYLNTHAPTRHVPILTQSPWKFPNGPRPIHKTLLHNQDRMILFPCSSRPTHSATISLSFSATKPTTKPELLAKDNLVPHYASGFSPLKH